MNFLGEGPALGLGFRVQGLGLERHKDPSYNDLTRPHPRMVVSFFSFFFKCGPKVAFFQALGSDFAGIRLAVRGEGSNGPKNPLNPAP